MRSVVTRVKSASVSIDGEVKGAIGQGFLVLLGVGPEDTEATADKLAEKICNVRVFSDEAGKMNLSLDQVQGDMLVISQFTLYADCRKGYRPSFTAAGAPDMAEALYEYILEAARQYVPDVQRGIFGADMKVSLLNDGPFTVILDSAELFS